VSARLPLSDSWGYSFVCTGSTVFRKVMVPNASMVEDSGRKFINLSQ